MNPSLEAARPFQSGVIDDFNLTELLDTLLQKWWLVASITLLTLAAGVIYAVLSTPIYQADTLIQVENDKRFSLNSIQEAAEAISGGSISVAGEVDILQSREVLMQAITATQADVNISVANRVPVVGDWLARRHQGQAGIAEPLFGLDQYAWGGESLELAELVVPEAMFGEEFTLLPDHDGYLLLDPNDHELVRARVGEPARFTVAGAEGRIIVSMLNASASTRFAISRSAPITAYRQLRSSLSVEETSLGSSILRLSYRHPDLNFAGKLVNAIARAYLTQNVERRSAEAQQSLAFLETQLPAIRQNVTQSEEALNTYKIQAQTFSVDNSAQSLLNQSVDAEKRRIELELQREALTHRYQAGHPSVRVLDEQLATTIREAEKLNEMVNALPLTQRDLLRLQRDSDVNSQLYIALLNNAQQLRVAKAGTVGNVRIIDFAMADRTPVAPKKPMVVALAGTLGLLLGIAVALLSRALRPTLRDSDEVERTSGLAVYVSVPESPQQERLGISKTTPEHKTALSAPRSRLLAALNPEDPAVESLRSLRTGLAFALMEATDKNIVLTGPTAAVGKSFVAANLSALLASAGKRVLLIDADLRSPRLGSYFGYRKVSGLSDVLAGTVTLDAALRKNLQAGLALDVLPAGRMPPNPGELLLNERFGALLHSVQERYDHIVIDTAPLLPVADTLAVVQHASTIFIVARSDCSTAREVRESARKLEAVGRKAKGIIFNSAKRRRMTYGYGYGYRAT